MKNRVQCVIRVSYKDEDFETISGHKHDVIEDEHEVWLPYCIASAVNDTMRPRGMIILASAVVELATNFDTDQEDVDIMAFREAAHRYLASRNET